MTHKRETHVSAAVPCERCRFQNMKNSPRAFAASAAVSAAGGRQPKKSAPSSQKGRSKERITCPHEIEMSGGA